MTSPPLLDRSQNQTAAQWQEALFDDLVRKDPVEAFGKGPMQEVLWQKRAALAIEYAIPRAPSLDVGCGNGRIPSDLASAYLGEVVGIDVSAECVHYASAHNKRPNIRYLQASIETFSPESELGLVTMYEVLEHLDDPDAALRRVASWLLPGGHLVLSTPNRSSLNRRLKSMPGVRRLYQRAKHVSFDSVSPGHVDEYPYDQLMGMLRGAGLEIERTLGAILLMPFPDAIPALARRPGFARLNVRSGDWCPRLAGHVYVIARKPAGTSVP